jgi:hypothetical protein
MGRKGKCYDNAAPEAFSSRLPNALLPSYPLDESRTPIFNYIKSYSDHSLLYSSLAHLRRLACESSIR